MHVQNLSFYFTEKFYLFTQCLYRFLSVFYTLSAFSSFNVGELRKKKYLTAIIVMCRGHVSALCLLIWQILAQFKISVFSCRIFYCHQSQQDLSTQKKKERKKAFHGSYHLFSKIFSERFEDNTKMNAKQCNVIID